MFSSPSPCSSRLGGVSLWVGTQKLWRLTNDMLTKKSSLPAPSSNGRGMAMLGYCYIADAGWGVSYPDHQGMWRSVKSSGLSDMANLVLVQR